MTHASICRVKNGGDNPVKETKPRKSKTTLAKAPARRGKHQGKGRRILVTGATGFLGREVLTLLLEQGWEVVALSRRPAYGAVPPGVIQVFADVAGKGWQRWCEGCSAAIHLVGIIRDNPRRGETFHRLHVGATEQVVAACKAFSIPRLVHMSALGARASATTTYHKSKWEAEQAVRRSGLAWTIFRPSFMFGPGDGFTSAIVPYMRRFALFPVFGDGHYKLQPISVKEVAKCLVAAVDLPVSEGEIYELGGPEQLTYNEILLRIAATFEVGRFLLHIPPGLARPIISLLQHFPSTPITRDQLTMLMEGSTCDTAPSLAVFGVPLEHYEGPIWLKENPLHSA